MDAWHFAILIAVALAGGIIDAVAGGGGLVTLPTLLALGLPPHVAVATNKGQGVWGTASALWTYAQAGQIERRLAMRFVPLAGGAALLGAWAATMVAPAYFANLVVGLLIIAMFAVWLRPLWRTEGGTPRVGPAMLAATLIAAYDGFFGPGTGMFLVVVFTVVAAMSPIQASAHAKVVNLTSNAGALALFVGTGLVRWELALPMACAQLVGGRIGAKLTLRHGGKLVRVMVTLVCLGLCAKLIWAR